MGATETVLFINNSFPNIYFLSSSISESKFVILSKSIPEEMYKKIETDAKKSKISTLKFDGTSVSLGKLCGLQFRISAISLPKISESDIKSLIQESET